MSKRNRRRNQSMNMQMNEYIPSIAVADDVFERAIKSAVRMSIPSQNTRAEFRIDDFAENFVCEFMVESGMPIGIDGFHAMHLLSRTPFVTSINGGFWRADWPVRQAKSEQELAKERT